MSQKINRKNSIDFIAAMNTVEPSVRMTEAISDKTIKMRSVHSSCPGFLCCVRSHDTGPKVGTQKQLAVLARIDMGSSILPIEKYLLEKMNVVSISNPSIINLYTNVKIFTNGKLLGITSQNPFIFVKELRDLRRKNLIYRHTSISVDQEELDI